MSVKHVTVAGGHREAGSHVRIGELADDISVPVKADLAAAFIPEAAYDERAVRQNLHRLGGVLNPFRPATERVAHPGGCVVQRPGIGSSPRADGLAGRETWRESIKWRFPCAEGSESLAVMTDLRVSRIASRHAIGTVQRGAPPSQIAEIFTEIATPVMRGGRPANPADERLVRESCQENLKPRQQSPRQSCGEDGEAIGRASNDLHGYMSSRACPDWGSRTMVTVLEILPLLVAPVMAVPCRRPP